jgi:TetR/AcrR family transcriptional regulator
MVQRKPKPTRDAELTKQQILDAAELEFARQGLQGARLSAIAAAAGVTTAMIHYYFENKEGLYKSVLQRPATEAEAQLASLNLDTLPPLEALETMVSAIIAYETLYPHRQMLWFQEANQNRGEYFKLSQAHWSNVHSYLFRILERGITQKIFRESEDVRLTALHIISICIFYFTVHENWKHLTPDVDRLSPAEIDHHTQIALRMILAGIQSR